MDNQNNIRNMSVIAHVDHGKSTLTDSLIARAGIISQDNAGDARYTDGRPDEAERGITIKSTGVSLYYKYDASDSGKDEKFLINLIDSPGHVDFSSEVTAALRVTDGALVVVDYVEGVCVQTETVLRQSLQELIKPVLMINKCDRALFELKHNSETMYQNFLRVIENANVIISTYQNEEAMGNLQVYPDQGTVAFGSALHGWGFTLTTFAKIYAVKLKQDKNKLLRRLWGDNYYNPKKKKWSNEPEDENIQRAFCSNILEPLIKLANTVDSGEKNIYQPLLEKLGIKLEGKELELQGKKLMRKVMQKWINASDALLEMIILHLPSPKISQKYRTLYLYQGPMDDECAKAMMECNPNGPVMMFISKMVPTSDNGRFYAFGRVFSGKVKAGEEVRILGPDYKQGKQVDFHIKRIQRVVIWMGRKADDVADVPCGNTCSLVGVDEAILKQGTITTSLNAHTIRSMKYSVSPVVRVAVNAKNPADLPKLVSGLLKMSKADPLVQVINTETEHIICGSGELHLEICLKDLIEDYAKIEIVKSDPIVPYKETVTEKSSQICMSKSPNKHNRLYVIAEPLDEDLVKEIENGNIKSSDDSKQISRTLIDKYQWDQHDAKKLWVFGPDQMGPNFLVDQTKAVQYLTEIRDSMESAFQNVVKEGVLAEENLRGVRFNIQDVELHNDSIHRGGGQIIPTARRVYYASEITAIPRYQEPIYLCNISTPQDVMNGVYQCFSQRRGVVFNEESVQGTPLLEVKAYLPVSESFGFTAHLRSLTSGQAFPQSSFSHWDIIKQDPFDVKSKAYEITMAIRKRKGLKQELPILSDYIDKA
ncbi:MAG: GTP-binding protein [Clostridia bacterium]|nr:GTP-binding protein [Clostridia bacterium]